MEQIILIVHLLISLAIIGLIMLQQGKGADMGASFGAGASQTLFGSGGTTSVLTRATGWLVVLFFTTSFSLALIANQKYMGVDELDLEIPAASEEAPASEIPRADEGTPAAAPQQPEPAEDVPEL